MLPAPITTIGLGAEGAGHCCFSDISGSGCAAIVRWRDATMPCEETIMPRTIVKLTARDIRMPTSESKAGSDAMQPFVLGLSLEKITADMAGFWRRLSGESQLRWIGPEKGAIHLATAAIVNAVWDLWAKVERKPVWKLVSGLTPEQIVGCIDFRYLSDALTRDEALEILRKRSGTRAVREAEMRERGYPAYITSAGWMGYADELVRKLCREARAAGWTRFKIKVGRDSDENVRRAALVREEIGPGCLMMMDANQAWDVGEAIDLMRPLARFDPLWIEEPTSPDDILGHATIRRAIHPIGVATGEHGANRVIFKQLLQAGAIDFCQLDGCRLGGLSEALAVMLLAAKFDVPVCPHAGGSCLKITRLAP